MARCCELTGKKSQFGHNVSHAKNRTNRRFLPNLQRVSLYSDILQRPVRLRISMRALRAVQHNSGLDKYLLSRDDADLAEVGLRLKHKIQKVLSASRKQPEKAA